MKKALYIILSILLVYLTLGASCEDHYIDLPVVGSVQHTFTVNENGNSYSEQDFIDFATEVAQLKAENAFDSIRAIKVESVSYTILNNNSGSGATITGQAQCSADISPTTLQLLANMSGLDLAAVEGSEQFPDLVDAGVAQINKAIDLETGTNVIYFKVDGTSTQSVLDFDIQVKITFTIIGQIKTQVPVI